MLRHDRAELAVEGAGDARVNGRYTSKGAAAWFADCDPARARERGR